MTSFDQDHNRRIKVLYIQIPPGGGSLIALYEMVNHLNRRLVDPVILCYYKNKFTAMLEKIEDCRVIYLFEDREAPLNTAPGKDHGRFLNYFYLQVKTLNDIFSADKAEIKKIYDLIKKEKPAIVHHNNDILVNRNCVRAARKAGIKQIVHNRSLAGYGHNLVNFAYDFLLIRKVSFQINITQSVSTHFNKLFRLPPKRSAVIPDIVDREKYKPCTQNPSLKARFGIANDEYVVTSIGRLIKWKGQHILIEAAQILRDQFPKIKFLLVGPDDSGVGSKVYADELRQRVISSGMEDKVIFAGNRDDIPEIINISDIVVHTSVKPEPQGLVIIEALLCKKKVVAVDRFGSGEIISKYGGIPVKPGDAEALAALLKYEIKNNGVKNDSVNDSRYKKLINDFDPVKQAAAIMSVYQNVLA